MKKHLPGNPTRARRLAASAGARLRRRAHALAAAAILNSFFESDIVMMSVSEIVEAEEDGIFIAANIAAAQFFKRCPEQMAGLRWSEAGLPLENRRSWIRRCLETARSGKPSRFEGCRTLDGETLYYEATAYAVSTPAGAPLRFTQVVEDITGRKKLEQEREALLLQTEGLLHEAVEKADTDLLTGLLNHRAFHKRLEEEADRCQREGTSLAVAVMDLDNFKFFNDAYGYAAGDQVLREVASALQRSCRSYDVLARFGGDEFAMLLPGVDGDTDDVSSDGIAKRLRGALNALGFRPPDAEFSVPVLLSAGVALFPGECPTRSEAIEMASARLRRSKLGTGDEEQTPAERLSSELTDSTQGFAMLNALVTAVDAKDRYTRRHSEDVMRYSLEIARVLGLGDTEQKVLATAALLHDVGKIGVPDKILRKPGQLTDAEYDAVRQHAQMGAAIVGVEPNLNSTLGAIRHHHERWDGAGYPHNLAGDTIPLHARIMAVADAFSAMTTDRPYRQGMPEAQAMAILQQGAGTQWDPTCVSAFRQAKHGGAQIKPLMPSPQNFRFSKDGEHKAGYDDCGGEMPSLD